MDGAEPNVGDNVVSTGPLTGIRVLDLSRFIAGPLCAQILADMGAEVIKLERPAGEDARHHAPFLKDQSVYVMLYSRNKYGATLNTRDRRGLELLGRLIGTADVVVENFRPGTMAAMGFPWETLHAEHPRLVLTSISGFGQTGPLAHRALFDAIAQAMSGLMSLTGKPDDEPMLTGAYIADYVAGFQGALGTLLALFHRERSGEGQWVDVASLDALFTCLGTAPSAWAMLGLQSERRGSRDQLTAPANVFKAKDAYVYIHAGTNPLFPRLCEAMGRAELARDPRFKDVPSRMANVEEIETTVRAWVASLDYDAVAQSLEAAGIPFGKVGTVEEVAESEQMRARDMLVKIDHPSLGTLTLPGIPIKLNTSPGEVRKPPPMVGEDNDFVYRGLLGLSSEDLQELRTEGVI